WPNSDTSSPGGGKCGPCAGHADPDRKIGLSIMTLTVVANPLGLLRRFSSRIQRLDHAFLRERLRGARSYDRIAGYFRSSIFEVAAEELLTIGRVRVVCNSDLNPEDLRASKEARASAMLQRWWGDGAEGSV